MSRSQPLIKK